MSFSTMPRMTASNIEKYLANMDSPAKVETYCVRHKKKWALVFVITVDGEKKEIAMSSQREDTRTFATLEAARKACEFVGGMTVIGK